MNLNEKSFQEDEGQRTNPSRKYPDVQLLEEMSGPVTPHIESDLQDQEDITAKSVSIEAAIHRNRMKWSNELKAFVTSFYQLK